MDISDQKQSNLPYTEVDVAAIMDQVRKSIQQNRQAALKQGLRPQSFTFDDYPGEPISGNYDVELYVHLRQVNQPHKILGVRRVLRSSLLSRLPLIGWLWQQIQRAGHDLVIFYVVSLGNEVAAYQRHVAGVLNRLVGWSRKKDDEIRLLQEEIRILKERVETLEGSR